MTFDFREIPQRFGYFVANVQTFWDDLTQHSEFLSNLLIAALILMFTLFLSQWLSNTVRNTAKRYAHSDADRTLPEFLSQVVWWLIMVVGLVVILNRLGVQTTSILTVLGRRLWPSVWRCKARCPMSRRASCCWYKNPIASAIR
ncbi:hypothetical protein [Asticcacaulis sp.]|uniref:hypothetical protein n=1 Tax=Asticcacaulis sp. TaxID=1872648 RepID=UPI0031E0ED8B